MRPGIPSIIEEAAALERILGEIPAALPLESPLEACPGRYLCGDIFAHISSPPFDCSAMDGYALASTADGYPAGSSWKIAAGSVPAGCPAGEILPGQALRIFTGAPVPANTGAIAMQEDVELLGSDPPALLKLRENYREGEFIRRAGSDLCTGQLLVRNGSRLTPQVISAAASQGLATLPCPPRPRVALLTTGNELVAPGNPLPPGSIHNSNLPLTRSLLAEAGAEVAGAAHSQDDQESLLSTAEGLLTRSNCEILVSCGGVSVGDHDHINWVTRQLGFQTVFWGVRMKPGKPFLFAAHPDGKWFFGLPGNPASAFVCFHRLVAPALRKRMGASADLVPPPLLPATLQGGLEGLDDRPHHIRGQLDSRGVFRPTGIQQSHAIAGLARCNALLHLAPGETLADGESITVTPV